MKYGPARRRGCPRSPSAMAGDGGDGGRRGPRRGDSRRGWPLVGSGTDAVSDEQFIDVGTMVSPTVLSVLPDEQHATASPQLCSAGPSHISNLANCILSSGQAAVLFALGMENEAWKALKDGSSLETI